MSLPPHAIIGFSRTSPAIEREETHDRAAE